MKQRETPKRKIPWLPLIGLVVTVVGVVAEIFFGLHEIITDPYWGVRATIQAIESPATERDSLRPKVSPTPTLSTRQLTLTPQPTNTLFPQAPRTDLSGNACNTSCCTANADVSPTMQHCWLEVHHCDGPLVDGRCIVAAPVIYEDVFCIPEDFCGSYQVDVVCESGPAGSDLAITSNGEPPFCAPTA
ncbi:MAG: hypothetical protein GYB65_05995 [Chloroflexi bacterium]|nr:hypothetical protein [Chloroflexota bacterium]